MKKKVVSLVLVVALAMAAGIGGTLAWLMDTTDPVVNTFTVGNIDIELAETTGDKYKMVPGNTIEKNPTVTVKANSEACWLFVKIEKANDFDKYMEFDIADGWTALDGVTGVYYREVAATTADTDFIVLKDNKVTVKDTVTKKMMDDLTEATYPTLTFTAYAVQEANVETVADAWDIATATPAA